MLVRFGHHDQGLCRGGFETRPLPSLRQRPSLVKSVMAINFWIQWEQMPSRFVPSQEGLAAFGCFATRPGRGRVFIESRFFPRYDQSMGETKCLYKRQSQKELHMEILERQIKFVFPEKKAERRALGPKIDAIEQKYGFPPNRQYETLCGPDEVGTLILEREWPSFAAMEEAHEKAMQDSEYRKLLSQVECWIREAHFEFYSVVKR